MIEAHEALRRLQNGNRRFVAGLGGLSATNHARRSQLLAGQKPFAILLGCADSRVPAELVFDQGLGELFVIRVAGNIVAPSQIGSVEFAVERYETKLVVVLGHSNCGAVDATLEELQLPIKGRSPNLRAVVDRIRPSVEPILESYMGDNREQLMRLAVRANIRNAANHLRHGSRVLEHWIANEGVMVVGAEYSLETGIVDFFDGAPDPET
ncbi:MAG: carbonic anhydrase [Lautropia sp.]|nr:carbonic anhydrase [Lautropia sp.]